MSEMIYSSIEFGAIKNESEQYNEEESGKGYDITDELGANILDYKIKKISYILKENERIDKIRIEYINKKDGTSKIIETPTWEEVKGIEEAFELEDDEEIKNIKIYLKEIKLLGFEIFTNKGKNKKIGFGEESEVNIQKELENGSKLIIGFGFNASKVHGVYSIRFYYVDKK